MQRSRPAQYPELLKTAISQFIEHSRRPALLEPGEPLILLTAGSFDLEPRGTRLIFQAWNTERHLTRRIASVLSSENGRLTLGIEKFAGRTGEMQLVDLAHPRTREWERRGSRKVFRERFRHMLSRELPAWRIAELSSEPDLKNTLSPVYPRALLIRGTQGIAAVCAPPDAGEFPPLLTYGLIWLDYVRRRNPNRKIDALLFWAPSQVAPALSFFLPLFDPARARFGMYLYSNEDFAIQLDPTNYGNVHTQLDICHRPEDFDQPVDHAETVALTDGSLSLRVNGLEFSRYTRGELRTAGEKMSLESVRGIATSLHTLRNPRADRTSAIWQQNPEAWLESVVRSHLHNIDATLRADSLYGQVPAIAGQSRSLIDLLGVDHRGRLAVLELKATADVHLPLQALDYWLRVRWHLESGEFAKFGYFPGVELRKDTPRLLLIAPALEFHPTSETILSFLRPEITVERIGLSADWRETTRVMFRLIGAERPASQ